MIVLGLESSCDETAVGIVDDNKNILANVRLSHLTEAAHYGGVIPEFTARAHLIHMTPLIREALRQANITLQKIDAVAATCGPGLIGGVLVGAMTGKALAYGLGKPFIAVNHLEAHILTPRLEHDIHFPFLTLLVSGGHCQILYCQGVGQYSLLGSTRDDAVGESFDKVGKMMGISYPAGPALESLAQKGCRTRFAFPRPMLHGGGFDFSFSGLKTAVRLKIENLNPLSEQDSQDIAASFEAAVADVLCSRLKHALDTFPHVKTFVVSGGVAANLYIKSRLEEAAKKRHVRLWAPSLALCTDNGAMVAWAGAERLRLGLTDHLDFTPRPKWPLSTSSPESTQK